MFKRTILLVATIILALPLTTSVAFAAQGQITEVNPSGISVADGITDVGPSSGISVADGITDVVSPPGIVVGLKEVFAGRPGGKIASSSDTHTGSSSVN
jgi:hypothetical protein